MSRTNKITAGQLIAATYFMVAGGPYGLEELVANAGYAGAIAALLLTPLVWCLPTAFMVSELSSALPEEGGYYAWVKRAMGPFWGFQEAWLSLSASVFEMAIYPTIFVMYLGRLFPVLAQGNAPIITGITMISVSGAWNLLGARAVGGSSIVMSVLLLGPFAALAALAFWHPSGAAAVNSVSAAAAAPAATGGGMVAGIMIAMWNYLGWDNSSTIAGEVRDPQRTYPFVMGASVALVAVTYVIPVAAAWYAGVDPSRWETGSWVEAAGVIGGPWLAKAVMIGGAICGIGMFHSLVLAYSRVPYVMAEEGLMPKLLAKRNAKNGAPWVSIIVCCLAWASCLGIGFAKLVEINVAMYGLSLLLEFAALVTLRIREPHLVRPFKVWGGTAGACLLGVGPACLVALALVENASVEIGGVPALAIAAAIIAGGPLCYWLAVRRKTADTSQPV